MFLKNYFFFRLYPPENIMGGKSAKKKSSSLNWNSEKSCKKYTTTPKMTPIKIPAPV